VKALNNKLRRIAEPGARLYLLILFAFILVSLWYKLYIPAAVEGGVLAVLILYSLIIRKKKERDLEAYIEEITYNTENAKNNTLMNFPLPISVFQLNDSKVVWGNEMFFEMCGTKGNRTNSRITDLVPNFTSKWLTEGQSIHPGLLEMNGKKYQVHGNIIRSEQEEERGVFMGITYWVDISEYERIREEYLETRPVVGIIIIDNLEEIVKNQPDRIKNDIRDAVEDRLDSWAEKYHAIIKRFERDRYVVVMEKREAELLRQERFSLVEEVHKVMSPAGINASLSIGMGVDGDSFTEALQFANVAAELALSRGGDQAVIKNKINYEFFGGRGYEVEKRTKVRSRVMANTLCELICDSSKVLIMGHRFSDKDAIGAAVGICALARKCGVKANIVADTENTAAGALIEMVTSASGKDLFVGAEEALFHADSRTLLIVVDTNRPEQVEDKALLDTCNRVAVIDHHRVGATYINNAGFVFIEPYASSACELVSEILEESVEPGDITKTEADALLAGIVLDTKNFTLRTGDRTFDAAAWLRRNGSDTVRVKKLMQTDMARTVERYRILQEAELYRNIAIACPQTEQNRVVAAQAADELLNISGVEASVVVAPDGKGGVFASARSIGEMNVQILMEKLGGGGNRSAAAFRMDHCSVQTALERLHTAIDEYLDNK